MRYILEGLSRPATTVSETDRQLMRNWIVDNAERYWLVEGGPLSSTDSHGAHVIVVDDPQMAFLIPLIKDRTPNRPVLYRSHMAMRADLINESGSPQHDLWGSLWSSIKHADMFIGDPVPQSVPRDVPREKLAFLPPTTDWLDGLNKQLTDSNCDFYREMFNQACHAQRMTELQYPARKYFAQLAPFDSALDLHTVLNAYYKFHQICRLENVHPDSIPQLVLCGPGSNDSVANCKEYNTARAHVKRHLSHIAEYICLIQLMPNDRLFNMILSRAYVVLHFSKSTSFDTRISEAIHAGRPVMLTKQAANLLQLSHISNAFVVDSGDSNTVAGALMETVLAGFEDTSDAARASVSDEMGTVGNAMGWYYLASKWAEMGRENGGRLKGDGRWVNDMAREEAGFPYEPDESRLRRDMVDLLT